MDEILKNRIVSIAATFGIHVIIILLLWFYVITPSSQNRWTEPLEGVPVMFGNVPDAFGDNEPSGRGNNVSTAENTATEAPNEATVAQPEAQQPVAPAVNDRQAVVTQDMEESVTVKEAEKAAEEQKRQAAAIAERERAQKAEAERKAQQRQNINNSVAGLFGNGSGDGSRGNTTGTGTQGVPTGNASYGKTTGVGGWGSYDLGGRGIGRGGLVKPNYTANDYGTVVIDITVDPRGNVINATLGKGTTVAASQLLEESLRAARSTKFNPVNTQGNQNGKIRYMYNLN